MAAAIFEAIAAGMDSQTAMAVQSLLDSQNVTDHVQETPVSIAADDDDLFQCGKCKKQFTSLAKFVTHKQTRCTAVVQLVQPPINSQSLSPSPNTAFTSTGQQILPAQAVGNFSVPASPLPAELNQCTVLTDDLITFNIEQPIQPSSLQAGTTLPNNSFLAEIVARSAGTATIVTITTAAPAPAPVMASSTGRFASTTVTYTTLPSNQLQLTGQHLGGTHTQLLAPAATLTNLDKAAGLPGRAVTITKADRKATNAVTLVMDEDNNMVKQRVITENAPDETTEELQASQGKRKHTCQYCDKTFSKNFDLAQHVRSHTGEKPFQCIVCGRAFAQKSNVKKHMQTHKVWPSGTRRTLPAQPIPVTVSEANGTDASNIHIHVQKQSSNGNSSLEVIGVSAVEGNDNNTKMNVIIDNTYLCQYCPEKFKTYFHLKTHMTVHKNEQVYKCVMKSCAETFTDMDSFLEHVKNHEEEMSYRCHNCNKRFSSLYELGIHQYSHSLYPNQGPKPIPRYFRCNKCNSKYSTPEALEHHMETSTHHYLCPYCEKTFTCERYLRRHLPTHGSVGEFQCSICKKFFKTEHYLKMHMLIHSGEKPFKCSLCAAEFNRKDKLKRHQLIHEPTKRYKCPFRSYTGCTREFNRPDKLKAHIITHSGLKPYKCRTCNRTFSRRSHLQEHEPVHTGKYKFQCDKCGRGFFRGKLLEIHKCRRKEDDLVKEPEMYRSKRKVGRPRKRIITVTEEIAKERSVRRMIGQRLRPGPRVARRAAEEARIPEETPPDPVRQEQSMVSLDEPEEATKQTPVPVQEQMVTLLPVSQTDTIQATLRDQTLYLEAAVPLSVSGTESQTLALPVNREPLAAVTMNLDGTQTAVQVTMTEANQLIRDGMSAQVITIQPTEFTNGQYAVPTRAFLEQHQVDVMATSDIHNLSNATLIATGPNTATLVVNTHSELLEPIITVPAGAPAAMLTAEQMEGLQAEGVVFHPAEAILQAGEIHLQTSEQQPHAGMMQ